MGCLLCFCEMWMRVRMCVNVRCVLVSMNEGSWGEGCGLVWVEWCVWY